MLLKQLVFSTPLPASVARSPALPLNATRASMQSRKLKLPIPVTILTGSLGVGKTTALCSLVARKPAEEIWCCIVNEFGAVGVDAVAIKGSSAERGNVVVKQIAGGCMCCVLSGPLSAAIAQVIRQVKPDRVIIEPSGLGHPGGLIDILQGPHLSTALQLNAVICLVDLTSFQPADLMANSIAADQVTVADVLVGSKADAATPAAKEAFEQWACAELFPPKAEVLSISDGQLDSKWLNAPRGLGTGQLLIKPSRRTSRPAVLKQQELPTGDPAQQVHSTNSTWTALQQAPTVADGGISGKGPRKGQPQQILGAGNDTTGQYASCGWIFHQDDVFDQLLLSQLLQQLQPLVARVKGVFRVGPKLWVKPTTANLQSSQRQSQQLQGDQQVVQSVQQAGGATLQLAPICYRDVSMVEVIVQADSSGLQQLQEQLQEVAQGWQFVEGCSKESRVGQVALDNSVAVTLDTVWQVLQDALVGCLQK